MDSNVCPLVGVFPRTAVAAAQQEIVNLLKSLWGFCVIIFPLVIEQFWSMNFVDFVDVKRLVTPATMFCAD